VVLCSGLLSGSIELTQAWLPARTSSLLDLLLNISGGGCGAVVFSILHSRTGGTSRDETAGRKDRIT
jgi:glycopeptide antibiotics resistance protein